MGDSGALILAFPYASDLSNESNQGNPMLALGDSISFGRFMSEPLSWEKWSTFSHKKYVEEAERYSRPGSVAQKKAFFEAHYKRIAAQKAAAFSEQENSVDEQKTPDAKVDQLIQHNEDVEKVQSNEVESVKVEQTAPAMEKEALIETPVKKTSMNRVHNLESNDTVSESETNDKPKADKSLLKVIEIEKQNSFAEWEKQSVTSKKRSALSSLKSWFHCKTSQVPRSEKRNSRTNSRPRRFPRRKPEENMEKHIISFASKPDFLLGMRNFDSSDEKRVSLLNVSQRTRKNLLKQCRKHYFSAAFPSTSLINETPK